MFRGVAIVNLDAKGRLAIPSRHRDRLQASCESHLVITVDRDRCLLLYPEPEWEVIERQFAALPALDPTARALQRLYVGNAQEVDVDAQGRILVPPPICAISPLWRSGSRSWVRELNSSCGTRRPGRHVPMRP